MTVREAINKALNETGRTAEEMLAAEVLLAFCLNVTREDLFIRHDLKVSEADANKFFEILERFYLGEPVAYLTGSKEFYGFDFCVNKNVLIPRPETELLVEEVLKLVPDRETVKILDVGTGSGCIAVALAKHLKCAELTATDISSGALTVARKNAERHGVSSRIRFINTDLIDNVRGPFDIVVANLPYIGEKKYNFVSREAKKYEPHVALFGGVDGLRLYEKLFEHLAGRKWKPRFLLGEFGFLQGDEMRGLLNEYFAGWQCAILKDYASIERIFVVAFSPLHTSRRRVWLK